MVRADKLKGRITSSGLKFLLLCGALSAALIGSIVLQYLQPNYDADGCQIPAPARTALLIDKSDPFSKRRQVVDTAVLFDRLVDKLEVDERLSIYIIGDRQLATGGKQSLHVTPSIAVEKHTLCRPPTTREELAGRRSWNKHQPYISRFKEKRERIKLALFAEASDAPDTGGTSDSPILEYIQQIADFLQKQPAATKRFIIISDFGQNVPGRFDICGPQPTFAQFSRTPYYQEVRSNLAGVTVELNYIERRGGIGMNCNARVQRGTAHQLFWRNYFIASGATMREPLFGPPLYE